MKGVSARYGGSNEQLNATTQSLALSKITLTIRPGEIFTIYSRKGSGKSSLIPLLLRLLDPLPEQTEENNVIYINDTTLHRLSQSILRPKIIAEHQDTVLLPDVSFLPDGSSF
jgi:ATP-binding cassette, subfamily C (CFTR/MRP), member 1